MEYGWLGPDKSESDKKNSPASGEQKPRIGAQRTRRQVDAATNGVARNEATQNPPAQDKPRGYRPRPARPTPETLAKEKAELRKAHPELDLDAPKSGRSNAVKANSVKSNDSPQHDRSQQRAELLAERDQSTQFQQKDARRDGMYGRPEPSRNKGLLDRLQSRFGK